MKGGFKRISAVLLLWFISCFYEFSLAEENIFLSLNADRLTADIKDATIKDVLEMLSEKCGSSVFIEESIQDKRITVKFENQPLEKAVKRLVAPYNSALIFSQKQIPSGKKSFYISHIKVFQGGTSNGGYINIQGSSKPPAKRKERVPRRLVDAEFKKLSDVVFQSAAEEKKIKNEINRLKESLVRVKTEKEKQSIQEQISKHKKTLEALEKENRSRIKKVTDDVQKRLERYKKMYK